MTRARWAGDWSGPSLARPAWEAYAGMHARELRAGASVGSGSRPCLIFMARDNVVDGRLSGGFADRMTGLISSFAVAILANATFLIDWPDLARLFASPLGLQWHCPGCADDALRLPRTAKLHFPFQSRNVSVPSVIAAVRFRARVTVIREARGQLHKLVGHHVYAQQLAALGLTRSSAFRELHAALFAPTPFLIDRFEPELRALRSTQPSVALQMRLGDLQIKNSAVSLKDYEASFACARALAPGAIIYLMSDSQSLKEQATAVYGSTVVAHMDRKEAPSLYHNYSVGALTGVAGDQLIARQCDYHVVSERSGLGLQAFFLSDRVDPARLRLIVDPRKACQTVDATRASHAAQLHSSPQASSSDTDMDIAWLARRWSGI